jgi:hypothetical protein
VIWIEDTKMRKIIKSITILLICALFLAFAPTLQAQEDKSGSQQDSNSGLIQVFNANYFTVIGCKSAQLIKFSESTAAGIEQATADYSIIDKGKTSTVSVKSQLASTMTNGTLTSYSYQATFTLSNGTSFSIDESYLKQNIKTQTLETYNSAVTGTFNFSECAIEKTFVMGKFAEKQRNVDIWYANSTKNIQFHSNCTNFWDIANNRIVNGSAITNQNMIGENGTYKLDYKAVSDESRLKLNITYPDGTVIDPWTNVIFDYSRFPLLLMGVMISFTGEEWNQGTHVVDLITIIVGAVFLGPYVAFVIGAMAALEWDAGNYMSDMGGNDVMNIYCVAVSVFSVVGQVELGFFTDKVWDLWSGWNWLGDGDGDEGDWYWIPFISTFGIPLWHQCPWPSPYPDPPLVMLSYDESSSTYFEGVPFYIDNTYVGTTSSTIDLGPGTYTIEVPSYSSFDYLDVNGTAVYDNSVTMTLGEDDFATVTACYSSIPTFTLTVNAYDAYLGEYYPYEVNVYIDNNWVGTTPLQVQVPMGDHTFSVDATVTYSPYWPAYDVPFYDFTGDFNGYNPAGNTVMISIAYGSDSTINARYTQWQ